MTCTETWPLLTGCLFYTFNSVQYTYTYMYIVKNYSGSILDGRIYLFYYYFRG